MVKSVIKRILEEAAAKQDSRPVLKCIHYENGGAIATDSHRLVRFNDINQNKDFTATIDASTLLPYNESYPETDRLIPHIDDSQVKLTLDINTVEQLSNFLKSNGKNNVYFNISDKNKVNVSNDFGSNFEIRLGGVEYGHGSEFDGKQVSLNASYLYEALRYLKKLAKELREINTRNNIDKSNYNDDVVITFYGQLRPFLVTFLNMEYLITPVRKY